MGADDRTGNDASWSAGQGSHDLHHDQRAFYGPVDLKFWLDLSKTNTGLELFSPEKSAATDIKT